MKQSENCVCSFSLQSRSQFRAIWSYKGKRFFFSFTSSSSFFILYFCFVLFFKTLQNLERRLYNCPTATVAVVGELEHGRQRLLSQILLPEYSQTESIPVVIKLIWSSKALYVLCVYVHTMHNLIANYIVSSLAFRLLLCYVGLLLLVCHCIKH